MMEINQVAVNIQQLGDDYAGQRDRFQRRMTSHVGFFDRHYVPGAPVDLAKPIRGARGDIEAMGQAVKRNDIDALKRNVNSLTDRTAALQKACAKK